MNILKCLFENVYPKRIKSTKFEENLVDFTGVPAGHTFYHFYNLFRSSSLWVSYPGLPSKANIFFL